MHPRVTLTVTQGSVFGKEFVLTNRGRFLVGRAQDCDIKLPAESIPSPISRHHCVLAFEPPQLRVRDIGSRNGTFVNGEGIGHRTKADPLGDCEGDDSAERELHDGDEMRLGDIVVRVGIQDDLDTPNPFDRFPAGFGR